MYRAAANRAVLDVLLITSGIIDREGVVFTTVRAGDVCFLKKNHRSLKKQPGSASSIACLYKVQ